MVTNEIHLRPFNVRKQFTDENGNWMHARATIYGASRTGKTTKLISMLYDLKDVFGSCYRFSPTANAA